MKHPVEVLYSVREVMASDLRELVSLGVTAFLSLLVPRKSSVRHIYTTT